MARRESSDAGIASAGLSSETKALLEDYAHGGAPSRQRKREMLRELEQAVAQDAEPLFPLSEVDPDPPVPARRRAARTGMVVGIVAAAAAVAALMWTRIDAKVVSSSDGGPNAAQDLVERQSTVEKAALRVTKSATSARIQRQAKREQLVERQPETQSRSPHPDAAPAEPPAAVEPPDRGPSKPRPVANLDDEAASLSAVRRALRGGETERALELLSDHARHFRGGLLEQERKVLHVRALCAAGRVEQAERKRVQFVRRFPKSPHIKTMTKACTPDPRP